MESLDRYVHRLADAYGVGFATFCRRALAIPEPAARDLDHAPRAVLERLSAGTGVPVERLQDMTHERLWARLHAEAERWLATEAGQAYLASLPPPASRKS